MRQRNRKNRTQPKHAERREEATPPFREVAARSLRASGVTPAWCCWESQHAFWPREESLSDRLHALLHAICPTSSHAERRKTLPVLKAPPKKPKTASLQIRIEEEIRQKLDHYAEFIDASPS